MADSFDFSATYCGPPRAPEELWGAWNADPPLAALLALALTAFAARLSSRAERIAALAGIAVLALAFLSPLCALTVSLFSARVVHHLALVGLAAPLLALALPGLRHIAGRAVIPLLLVHTVIFWLWHAPLAYEHALASSLIYWVMQVTLLATAVLFWAGVLSETAPPGQALGALLLAIIQMGMLGALITFATSPLYLPHIGATAPFGLTPLADQQLAGLIMWVPASLPYLLSALLLLLRWFSRLAEGHGR